MKAEKSRKKILILGLILLVLWTICAGCRKNTGNETAGEEQAAEVQLMTLYYTDGEYTEIIEKTMEVPLTRSDLERDKVEKILDCLMKEEKGLVSIIPKGMIRDFTVIETQVEQPAENREVAMGKTLQIVVSKDYDALPLNQKVIFRIGIAQALFSIHLVDKVEFVAQEDSVLMLKDTVSDKDRVYINQYGETFFNARIPVTLYFMNAARDSLVAEERVLEPGITEPLSMSIMKALIEGPKEEGHLPVIPEGTKVNDVVLDESVCYVDLSTEFQLNHEGTEQLEKLTIYSIVNSLSSVDQVERVQFLIDGEKVPYYKTYVEIEQFLEPNMDLVEEKN